MKHAAINTQTGQCPKHYM